MFDDALAQKRLPFRAVLTDSWYAAKDLMMHIDKAGKFFYCPLKRNRLADDSQGENPARPSPTWNGSATKCCAANWSKHTSSRKTTR